MKRISIDTKIETVKQSQSDFLKAYFINNRDLMWSIFSRVVDFSLDALFLQKKILKEEMRKKKKC